MLGIFRAVDHHARESAAKARNGLKALEDRHVALAEAWLEWLPEARKERTDLEKKVKRLDAEVAALTLALVALTGSPGEPFTAAANAQVFLDVLDAIQRS